MELWHNLKFAWHYTKDQKEKLIKYVIASIISIIVSVVIPILSAKIIIALTDNAFYQIISIGILIFLIENVRNLIRYFSRYYMQVIYRETFSKLQIDLGREILKLENQSIDANGSGVFIQRLSNDTGRLAEIFNVLTRTLTQIIKDIGIFGAVFILNKFIFVYMVIMTIILYIIENIRVKKYIEKDKIFRHKKEKTSGFIGEIIRGARDIKMLNAEDSFVTELEHKIIDLNRTRYNMQDVERKYRLFGDFTRDLTDLLLIVLLVFLIKNNSLSIASALIAYNYSSHLPSIVNYIGTLLDKIKDFNLSASRIFAIIKNDEFKKETFGTKHLDTIHGDFEFKDVSFRYTKEDNDVLKHLNFKVKANETVAFVGKSGAGKSTIFNLLCKMYDVTAGTITIDGVDIKELDKDSIRGNITIINQNPYIFNLSIRENLMLVKQDMTEKEMLEACKMACLDDFIKSLPNQYDTIIGEGGVTLSGGQKQRLAIARALIQKTEIILFDEATSALDNETQKNIQKAISNLQGEYTILMIAHRLSTIIDSDRILLLNDGRIEAEGTHEQLLNRSDVYKKLYQTEIMKELEKI